MIKYKVFFLRMTFLRPGVRYLYSSLFMLLLFNRYQESTHLSSMVEILHRKPLMENFLHSSLPFLTFSKFLVLLQQDFS